jgi:hypothetical protein
MAKNTSQKFKVAAVPKIINSKSMSQSMRRTSNASNTDTLTKRREITFKIPYRYSGIIFSSEKKGVGYIENIGISPEYLAELKAKGYKPILVSLPADLEDEVVQVKITFLKSENLARPKSSIKNRKRNKVSTTLVCPHCRLETKIRATSLLVRVARIFCSVFRNCTLKTSCPCSFLHSR